VLSCPRDAASIPAPPDFVEKKWQNIVSARRGNEPGHADACRMPGLMKEGARKQGDDSKPGELETGKVPDIFEESLNSAYHQKSLGVAFGH
jgi:hypothetical protein